MSLKIKLARSIAFKLNHGSAETVLITTDVRGFTFELFERFMLNVFHSTSSNVKYLIVLCLDILHYFQATTQGLWRFL